uniref:TYRO protein tyrosine kinase-binding protein isoform X2 n=1 Tax=Callorhinus ursinus TaxID=34884 RepID=A0A3Q7MRX1_CALUR|nr:TYRO protein tyrosine kinase-binding protein isoform X2 [Callorhinus ursinus]
MGRLGLILPGIICLRPSSCIVSSSLLPPPTSDFLLHLVGRYTTSHRPLDSSVQQGRLRHGGPWTFQQAPVPASPSDCGWFQSCPGTESSDQETTHHRDRVALSGASRSEVRCL